ncbi:MAG: exo-alpha-sialidase, partial [Spirochaetales bacterium]|nr:exo-alpha-sialidase [Spirochaetales bacterium]
MIRNRLIIQQTSFFLFIAVLIFLPIFTISAQELFWENPELLVENNVWFPLTAYNEKSSIIMWQEFDESDNGSVEMSISLMTAIDDKNWIKRNKVLGPFSFTGDKVSISSLVVDASGLIYIAVSSSTEGILIYLSSDNGESFKLIGKPGGKETTTVSPKLFITESSSLILFVTQSVIENRTAFNQESTLGITYSVSSNGRSWSDYVPLVSGSSLSNVYLPFHVSDRNIEHVVFQASPEESRFYQLYHISSRDRGRTWSAPALITDIAENGNRSVDFDNQRVFLKEFRGNLYISWERKLGNGPALSYYGELNTDTGVLNKVEAISGDGISTNPVNNPQLYINHGIPVALWYNNIGQVVLAGRENNEWTGIDIPGQTVGGLSNFCRFLSVGNEMNIVWQSDIGENTGLTRLTQDKTVSDITVFPVNFKSSALSQDRYTVSWDLPSDSSGIAGFSYSLDRNE